MSFNSITNYELKITKSIKNLFKMKKRSVFRTVMFMCIAVLAVVFMGSVEPVGATEYFSSRMQEYAEFAPVLAAAPLLATVVREACPIAKVELDALKQKYGKIKILSVVIEPPVYDDGGKITEKGEAYYFVVRRPDAGHVRLLMDYAKKGDLDNYVKSFINNLIIAGDKTILETDGLVYLGLSSQIDEFLKPYKSFLSNA
jgi:hypothetical protein